DNESNYSTGEQAYGPYVGGQVENRSRAYDLENRTEYENYSTDQDQRPRERTERCVKRHSRPLQLRRDSLLNSKELNQTVATYTPRRFLGWPLCGTMMQN